MPSTETSMRAAGYRWYGTPERDGKWLHWDHPVNSALCQRAAFGALGADAACFALRCFRTGRKR
eukprot:1298895-Rhodomonas_salina.1